MSEPAESDRRAFTRVNHRTECLLELAGMRQPVRTENIGIGGALVRGTADIDEIAPDSPIELVLPSPARDGALHYRGRVARASGIDVAVQFTHFDVDALTHLRNLVTQNCGDGERVRAEIVRRAQAPVHRGEEGDR